MSESETFMKTQQYCNTLNFHQQRYDLASQYCNVDLNPIPIGLAYLFEVESAPKTCIVKCQPSAELCLLFHKIYTRNGNNRWNK